MNLDARETRHLLDDGENFHMHDNHERLILVKTPGRVLQLMALTSSDHSTWLKVMFGTSLVASHTGMVVTFYCSFCRELSIL